MIRQSGQSMAEFAAGAAVMSLLLLGTLAMGRYQEVDRRGVLAARQLAWVQIWSRHALDANAVAAEVHREYFSDSAVQAPTSPALLVTEENLEVRATQVAPGGLAGAATAVLRAPLQVASGFLGGAFDLQERGLVGGNVHTRIAPVASLPAPFDGLDLQLQASHALLGDAWQAAGPAHVARRTAGLVPTGSLRAFSAFWRPLAIPLSVIEPSLQHLCLGLIEPDRIPEDRLGPGRTPLPEGCP